MKEEIQALSLTNKHELVSHVLYSVYEFDLSDTNKRIKYLVELWHERREVTRSTHFADVLILSLVYGD